MTITPQFPDSVKDNMARFMEALGDDAALLIAPKHVLRNGDAEYSYRQASDILYLTGWEDPEMALFINPKAQKPVVMFVQPKNPTMEIWTGIRAGVDGAKENFWASDAYEIDELSKQLPNLLMGVEKLHYRFAEDFAMDQLLLQSIAKARRAGKMNGLAVPETFCDPSLILHRQRLIKTPAEITILKKAAAITNEAHQAAMKMTGEGVMEYEIEAKIGYVFRRNGGIGPGYTSIVGGGSNAVILHYISNDAPLKNGDLLCVDAGCEYGYYTADVTRTWPVNGRFTEGQRELYEAVLEANEKAIAACVPGNRFIDVHNVAVKILTEAMVKFGLLEGDVEQLIADNQYKKYYMHGTSHWLGMDVHDVGPYVADKDSITLEPGMVLTVEPGLYIDANDDSVPEKYRGIGIRIEDDILVTADGFENLTQDIPKSVADIEAIVGLDF